MILVSKNVVDNCRGDEAAHNVQHKWNIVIARCEHLNKFWQKPTSEESCDNVNGLHNIIVLEFVIQCLDNARSAVLRTSS